MTFKKLAIGLSVLAAISACSKAPEVRQEAQPDQAAPSTTAQTLTYPTRDIRDEVFYFVLPDRFNNGNPDNDQGSKEIQISQGGLDTSSKWAFHGGDMQGLEQKLDYLQEMGITSIWMTPILRNQAIKHDGFGHHGYWIVDFTQIDPHFGSNEDLKSLIDAAHKKDIKVFFDIITNHTSDIILYEECHNPDGTFKGEKTCAFKSTEQVNAGDKYTPFVPEQMKNVKTPAWLNDPKYYNNQGDSFWQGESAINGDFAGLDDLNTRLPEVVDGMIDIYKNIITEFKPDGFRIDTVKHVDMSFWQEFSPAIMEHAKAQGIENFHVFGEVYGADPALLSGYTTKGKLPSVLDFGFQHAAAEVFYRGKSPQVLTALFDNDDYYSDADSQADILMNFLGNHDMGRAGLFINQANQDEDPATKLQRSVLSHGFMYLSRGIPVVYYGDEQGFTGDGGDVDAREDMFPSKVDVYNDNQLLGSDATTADDNFDQQHPLYQALKSFAKLRSEHQALRQGITLNRGTGENGTFAIARIDKTEQVEYLAAFNPSVSPAELIVSASSEGYQHIAGEQDYALENGQVKLRLAPLSYTLLKATTTVPVTTNLKATLSGVQELSERVAVDFTLGGAKVDEASLLSLTIESVDKAGNTQLLARDTAYPYRLIIHPEEYQSLKGSELKLTVTNGKGASESTTVTLP